MRSFFKFQNSDLGVMVGMASLLGALASLVWEWLYEEPISGGMSLTIVLVGFLLGRLLSMHTQRARQQKPKAHPGDLP